MEDMDKDKDGFVSLEEYISTYTYSWLWYKLISLPAALSCEVKQPKQRN